MALGFVQHLAGRALGVRAHCHHHQAIERDELQSALLGEQVVLTEIAEQSS